MDTIEWGHGEEDDQYLDQFEYDDYDAGQQNTEDDNNNYFDENLEDNFDEQFNSDPMMGPQLQLGVQEPSFYSEPFMTVGYPYSFGIDVCDFHIVA
jgi:hypothetical protein